MSKTVVKREYEQSLPCALTGKERLAFSKRMGKVAKAVGRAEANKRMAASQLKAIKAEFEQLADVVGSGIEYRDVKVQVVLDFDAGRKQHIRVDTGEIVLDEPMTEEDKQTSLVGEVA